MEPPHLSQDALLHLLDQHTSPTFVLGADGRVVLWNKACAALTGVAPETVLGTKDHWKGFYNAPRPCLADLVLNDKIELASDYYIAFSDSQIAKGAISVECWCDIPALGRRVYLAGEARPIFDGHGELIGVSETIRDLTGAKDAEARLRDLAGLDGLTGLPNRRTFDDALKNEWRRSSKTGDPLSVLMIDIDHFKEYNDSLGHACGDQCLSAVGAIIAEGVHRDGDLPARYGGEEFAVIIPDTDSGCAATVAESLRCSVEMRAMRHPNNSASPYVTASIGAATTVPGAQDRAEEIIRSADLALYQAKELGRNRVCAFSGEAAAATDPVTMQKRA